MFIQLSLQLALITIIIIFISIIMSSWSGLFFVLCSVLTPALCCDWVRHFGRLNGESLNLIQNMGGPLTEQQSPVPFPYRLYEHIHKEKVEAQLVFIRDSLIMISDLYDHDNLTSVTWNNITMEHFLSNIHRQTVELNSCVSSNRQVNLTSVTCKNNTVKDSLENVTRQTEDLNRCVLLKKGVDHKLRNYYRRLTRRTLDHTGGSAASWELIRKETKQHLGHLDVLMNSITASGAASRRRSTPTQ
ncbi:interferon a3-like [Notolabrus celidotus]|uniref:interferon a3-like n=1 Tax=Notolabrus celidotus TaxID=1203425 RepID=UPI00148F53C5|nr:interferon a3-like [Notolabrus celidotus]